MVVLRIKLFTVIALLQIPAVTSDEKEKYCTPSEIEAAVTECDDVYAGGNDENLEKLCPNLECYLQCLKDATGDCPGKELFVADGKVQKVLLRAKCVNWKLTKLAEDRCVVDTPCINDEFHQETVNIVNKLHAMPNNTRTKILDCRYSARVLQCISVKTTSNCTSDMARLVRDLEIVENSLTKCEIPQTHPFFNTYGGDIECDHPKIKSECFSGRVMERLEKCKPVASTLEDFLRQDAKVQDDICDDVECISECYEDAIGDCGRKEKYVMLDPVRVKISTRAICAHVDELADVIEKCQATGTSCVQGLITALTKANEQLLPKRQYEAYKDIICNATATFRSCISFRVTEDCTEKMAELATNMYQAWHSYSPCGPIHSAFIHRYDSDLECDSSASSLTTTSFSFLVFLVLSIFAI